MITTSSSVSSSTLRSTPAASSASTVSSRLLHRFLATEDRFAPALARVTLGFAILPHGAQKLFGWFGGYGFTGTMHWFTDTMHIPWLFGFAAIMAETLGGLALVAGFASRLAAAAVGAVFVTAVVTVHAPHGFFLNWFGQQKGEGVEYFLLGLALVAIVVVGGGGAASVDRVFTRRTAAS